MNCDEARDRWIEALSGPRSGEADAELESHLESCVDCASEASELGRTWRAMAALEDAPAPSDRMRIRFRAALGAYEASLETSWRKRLQRRLERLLDGVPPALGGNRLTVRLATAAGLLATGMILGWAFQGLFGAGRQVAELRREMTSMNRAVTLALLQHQSASERLRGVSWSTASEPDVRVLETLVEVAQRDESVNVRLAAVEALGAHLESPMVRSGLLEALEQRPDPQLQMTVSRLFARPEEGPSPELQRLLESDLLDDQVRRRLLEERAAGSRREG